MGKKAKHTEIVVVMDRSGSMFSMKDEAIGGMNAFVEDQKKVEGKAHMTVYQFDHEYDLVINALKLKKIPVFDDTNYQPRGTTALLDAVGRAITETRGRISTMDPEPLVIFVILTDGLENASKEYTYDKIKEMIPEAEAEGWKFVYLAADPQGFQQGINMGLRGQTISVFDHNNKGVRASYMAASIQTSCYRNDTSYEPPGQKEDSNG